MHSGIQIRPETRPLGIRFGQSQLLYCIPENKAYNVWMSRAETQHLGLFSEQELDGIQPSGSPWVISDDDPATVPVPLQTVIVKVDGPYTERDRKLWVFLLHTVFDELGEKPIHSLPIREVNAIFRELGGEHDTKWIWDSAKRLAKTTVEWETTFDDGRFERSTSLRYSSRS